MQIQREQLSDNTIKLTITADETFLQAQKEHTVAELGRNIKVSGFRAGKAPAHLLERQLDQSVLQTTFLEHAVNDLYAKAAAQEELRPTKAPELAITKFVPFTTLEFTADVEILGEVVLPDYKSIRIPEPQVKVTSKDVDEVLHNLRERAATKEKIAQPAKMTDEVTIDFEGTDAKANEPIQGADGKDYPLVLGSNSFIPGFEEELVGLKEGDAKSFTITFPKDYGVADLQNRKVTFQVTVKKVQKVSLATLDDAFAASVGPFKTVEELKADIKKQLVNEREGEARSDYHNQLLEQLAQKTKVNIPDSLIEAEIDRIEEEERRNLVYRGQTWQEHLKAEGLSEEDHRKKNRPGAELRVKAGIVLTEVAEKEHIQVTPDEVNLRLQLLKGRYANDPAMQAELDKPENRRDIASRILSEKTIESLAAHARKKATSKS